MKLSVPVKLITTPEQTNRLKETLELANVVCNELSKIAWENKTFRKYDLQKLAYHEIRKSYPLSAQMVIRCISKVADAYLIDKKTQRIFKKHGAIAYDDRILSWNRSSQQVSLWSISGRLKKIPYQCSSRQRELLQFQQGESDLLFRDGIFYLVTTCNIEEPTPKDVDGVLGVDLGIVNIAVDSDGKVFSGSTVNSLRKRHRRLRQKLQKKGTKSAKRLLKKRRRKESRFAKDVNHCISKKIVEKAKRTNRMIALEDLKGIRSRIRVRKSQRSTHSSWAFAQLGGFIVYKSQMAGVPKKIVDPRNTSRECPICGTIDKRNRKSQSEFSCIGCGFSGPADYIAAWNISGRADVNQPYAVSKVV